MEKILLKDSVNKSNHTLNKTTVKIKEIHYLNEQGNEEIFKVTQKPVVVNENPFTVGYVTKLNNKRWGADVVYTGNELILETDKNSPITKVLIEEI